MRARPVFEQPASRVFVAGIPIVNLSLDAAAAHVAQLATDNEAADIHLVNAYTVSLADTRDEFREVIAGATANLADGKPLTWAARWLSRRPVQQVPGPDLFERVLAVGHAYHLRHYLLGGAENTLSALRNSIAKRHPNARVVGSASPPYRMLTDSETRAQDVLIRASGANIVWVGLGTPKQDYEARRLAHSLGITTVAVGAAFDFSAGAMERAPSWVTRIGMEWLFRLAMEPRRLWRRYTVGNVRFIRAVVRHRRRVGRKQSVN